MQYKPIIIINLLGHKHYIRVPAEESFKVLVETKEEKLTVLSLLPVTIKFLPELDTQVSRHRTISV